MARPRAIWSRAVPTMTTTAVGDKTRLRMKGKATIPTMTMTTTTTTPPRPQRNPHPLPHPHRGQRPSSTSRTSSTFAARPSRGARRSTRSTPSWWTESSPSCTRHVHTPPTSPPLSLPVGVISSSCAVPPRPAPQVLVYYTLLFLTEPILERAYYSPATGSSMVVWCPSFVFTDPMSWVQLLSDCTS